MVKSKIEGLLELLNIVEALDGHGNKIDKSTNSPMYEYFIGKYCIIRTYAAGVHFGVVKDFDEKNLCIQLSDSRRLWYWEGAFTLSAIANNGIKDGKISETVNYILLSQVCEIIPCSSIAIDNLKNFKIHNG
jgi:hypothetical protein